MLSPYLPKSLRVLVGELSKLPSIGEKTAVRLAYNLLSRDKEESESLARAIVDARENTKLCKICFSLTEDEICSVCSDSMRAREQICVVEKPFDVIAIERGSGYRGLYHVLHGLWSPLRGMGPDAIRASELIERVRHPTAPDGMAVVPVKELILATGTTVEGDATALYLRNALSELPVKVSRIAQGLPKGGELEYADQATLSHAIKGRLAL